MAGTTYGVIEKILGVAFMGKRVFYAAVGKVTEEMIRNYIANQVNDNKDEILKIEDEFQS